MASSGVMIASMSIVTGMPQGTVKLYADTLRKAGLLSIGGRGTSAAQMTSLDAARLLVAISAAGSARVAADVVLAAQTLPYAAVLEPNNLIRKVNPPVIDIPLHGVAAAELATVGPKLKFTTGSLLAFIEQTINLYRFLKMYPHADGYRYGYIGYIDIEQGAELAEAVIEGRKGLNVHYIFRHPRTPDDDSSVGDRHSLSWFARVSRIDFTVISYLAVMLDDALDNVRGLPPEDEEEGGDAVSR